MGCNTSKNNPSDVQVNEEPPSTNPTAQSTQSKPVKKQETAESANAGAQKKEQEEAERQKRDEAEAEKLEQARQEKLRKEQEEREQKEREVEEKLQKEKVAREQAEEERKKQQEEEFVESIQALLIALQTDFFVSKVAADELQGIYEHTSDAFMKYYTSAESLEVAEIREVFLKDSEEPNILAVTELTNALAIVKDNRIKAEQKRVEEEFDGVLKTFLQVLKTDLGGKASQEELSAVTTTSIEKYMKIFNGEVVEADVVKQEFATDDGWQTELVTDLTEKMQEIKKRRLNTNEFDIAVQDLFQYIDNDGDGKLSLVELKEYYPEDAKDALSVLDEDGDGHLSLEEMKPLFKLPNGYYDVNRVAQVKNGFCGAVIAKKKHELELLEQEFDKQLAEFLDYLQKDLDSTVHLEELEAILPESAEKYISLLDIDQPPQFADVKKMFQLHEGYDNAQLAQLQDAVKQVIVKRIELFNKKTEELVGLLIPSAVKNLKVDKLVNQYSGCEDAYIELAKLKKPTTVEHIRDLFTVDGKPDMKGVDVIYKPLQKEREKILKKVDSELKKLIKFIGKLASKYKIKKKEVFQQYIDVNKPGISVADFNKKYMVLLNKPVEKLPPIEECRKLFMNKKTGAPDPKLVKGLFTALSKITDVRRLTASQNSIALDITFEKNCHKLMHELIDLGEFQYSALQSAEKDFPQYVPKLIQIISEHPGNRLELDTAKDMFSDGDKRDNDSLIGLAKIVKSFEKSGQPESKQATQADLEDELARLKQEVQHLRRSSLKRKSNLNLRRNSNQKRRNSNQKRRKSKQNQQTLKQLERKSSEV